MVENAMIVDILQSKKSIEVSIKLNVSFLFHAFDIIIIMHTFL